MASEACLHDWLVKVDLLIAGRHTHCQIQIGTLWLQLLHDYRDRKNSYLIRVVFTKSEGWYCSIPLCFGPVKDFLVVKFGAIFERRHDVGLSLWRTYVSRYGGGGGLHSNIYIRI